MDRKNSNEDSRPLVQLTKCRNYLFTIHDSILNYDPYNENGWLLAAGKLATGGWQLATSVMSILK